MARARPTPYAGPFAGSAPSLAARCQGSFMPAAFTHTAAPTFWRAAEISASRNFCARPPLPTQSAASRVSASAAVTWMLPAKADDVLEAEAFQEHQYAVQDFMNKIKSLLWRAHRS